MTADRPRSGLPVGAPDDDEATTATSVGDRSRQMLRGLRDIMADSGTTEDRLDRIVRTIAADMGAEVCSIYVRRSDNVLELCATRGLNPDAVHRTRLSVGEGLVGDIAARARPLSLADAQNHPKFAYRPETGEEVFQSLMGVPVLRSERVVGVLVVQNRTRRHYADEEIETVETFAMVLADLLAQVRGAEAQGQQAAPERLAGTALVEGLAIGQAYLHEPTVVIRRIVAEDEQTEVTRLDASLTALRRDIDGMIAAADQVGEGDHRDVLETYRMFAVDRGWITRMKEAIAAGLTAEAAVQRALNDMRGRLGGVADAYLRERLADFEDLARRLLRHLATEDPAARDATREALPADAIIVARAMSPTDLLDYDRRRIRGVVLEEGSATAHVVVVARAMDIPVIGNVAGVLGAVEPGDPVIVDGDNGQVFVRPGDLVQSQFSASLETRRAQRARYAALRDEPAISRDGVEVALLINAGLLVDVPQVADVGATGIGLYRTEIPFMVRRDFPDVAAQTEIYRRVYDAVDGLPVHFRALDAGGDKHLPSFPARVEENPALGWRSMRILLDRPTILRRQCRALIRAAAGRPLRVMFPMVTTIEEYEQARAILDKELRRTAEAGEQAPAHVAVGAMLEVPSLLWQLDRLLPRIDFLSIGSNDLMQYMFAADRGDEALRRRYDPLSPTFLSVLRHVARACEQAGVPVTVCGEMAGKPLDALSLVAVGYRRLSMNPASVGPVKEALRSAPISGLAELIDHGLGTTTASIRERIRGYCRDHGVRA